MIACQGNLKKEEFKLNNKKVFVLFCAQRVIPKEYEKNVRIDGLDNLILKKSILFFMQAQN